MVNGVSSLPHAPFLGRGYSISPAARLRRGGNEVLQGSTLPSRTTYQQAKATYRFSVMS
jgi:hypothetical protein